MVETLDTKGRKLARTLRRLVHYPDKIPALVKAMRVNVKKPRKPRKRFDSLTTNGVSIPHTKDEVCMSALRN